MGFFSKPMSPKETLSWTSYRKRGALVFILATSLIYGTIWTLVDRLHVLLGDRRSVVTIHSAVLNFLVGLVVAIVYWLLMERRYKTTMSTDLSPNNK